LQDFINYINLKLGIRT